MKYSASVQMTYKSSALHDSPMEAFLEMQSMVFNDEIKITVDNTSQVNIQTEEHKE